MKYIFIMIAVVSLIIACGQEDPNTIIILGPDGKPIDAGSDVKLR
jgi:hypothetical protein